MKCLENIRQKNPIQMFELLVSRFSIFSCAYILYQLRNFIKTLPETRNVILSDTEHQRQPLNEFKQFLRNYLKDYDFTKYTD